MSRMGKLKPNLEQYNKKQFNLKVLQRVDPSIDEIIFTTAQVTLYQFDIDSTQWSRKDVEGSLFVVKRNSQPRFQFIVMNRRSTENLVENIQGDFEFEHQPPYVLYRNESSEVNGIWFYNSRDSEDFANLLTRILGPYSKIYPKSQISATTSEFEELEKVPTTSVMDGPLEPVPATPARTDIADNSAFVNFFSAAMTIGSKLSTSMSQKDIYPATPNTPAHAAHSVIPSLNSNQSQPIIYSPPTPLPRPVSTIRNSNSFTNLVKPSSFFQPPSSTARLMTPTSLPASVSSLNSPMNNSPLNSAQSVIPFRPPTLQVPLSNILSSPSNRNYSDREKVRNALLMLAKDDQFIDLVYQALLKAHKT